MFFRISWNRAGANLWDYNLPSMPIRDQDRRAVTLTFSDTHIFGPTLINEFRFGIMREHNPAFNKLDGPALVKEFGLQGITWNPEIAYGDPVFSFNNFQEIGATDIYQDPRERIFQGVDSVTWMRGKHVVKAGLELRWNGGINFPGGTSFPVQQFGQFSFSGAFTNFDYADFLMGLPQTAGRANAAPLINSVNNDMAFFIQDDWKITPKLTLNLGVRYEYDPPYHEKNDNFYNFDPSTGNLIVPSEAAKSRVNPLFPSNLVPVVPAAQAGVPKSLYYSDLNNVVPRFGFAYRPSVSGRTVIRGGYGIYIDDLTSSLWRIGTGGPFVSLETFTNSITNGAPKFQFPNAFPAGFGAIGVQSFNAIDPHLRNPYIQQWNLTLEHEILNMGIRLSYIGTYNRKLVWTQNVNLPVPGLQPFSNDLRRFPKLNNILVRQNGGVQNYNSLHFVAERKWKSGLYYQFGWTWAKALTDNPGDGEGGAQLLLSLLGTDRQDHGFPALLLLDPQGLLQVLRAVQVADAATIGAAESRNGQKPLSYFPGDAALQVLDSRSDYRLLKASLRQKVVDMPASGSSNAPLNLQVSLYPLQASWTPCRACVGVVAPGKEDPAQATYGNLPI